MNALTMIGLAALAAVGNALFALGQRQSAGAGNGLLFVGASALVACLLALATAPLAGRFGAAELARLPVRGAILSGVGLFLTYVGFNVLYARYGTAPYVLYAALAIVTTTVGVGFLYLREPATGYHYVAILLAIASIAAFALGQWRR
jgi:drug/metabolite transporter (DMT)-like permease